MSEGWRAVRPAREHVADVDGDAARGGVDLEATPNAEPSVK